MTSIARELPLSTAFAAARGTLAIAPSPELEGTLVNAHGVGQTAWPKIMLSPTEFARHLARRIAPAAETFPRDLFFADLFLACAGALGEPRAVAELGSQLRRLVRTSAARIDRSPAFVDDVLQGLHETLLVARPSAPPRIAEYRGTGPLGAWLRVAVVRAALRGREQDRRTAPVDLDVEVEVAAPSIAPETELLRRAHGPTFNTALREALDALEPQQRLVLHLHHAKGLSIDVLAAQFGVHRATAARWVVAARVAVVEDTKRRLRATLRLSDADVESVLALVASQLDLTISRLG